VLAVRDIAQKCSAKWNGLSPTGAAHLWTLSFRRLSLLVFFHEHETVLASSYNNGDTEIL